MQHWNLCSPGDSGTSTVAPDATMIGPNPAGVAGHSGARVSGTVPAGAGGLTEPFNSAIDPPPKFVTSVNVWASPPLLVTRRVCPGRMSRNEGSNCQAGCPTTVLISGENSSARNSCSVTSAGCGKTAQDIPAAANVAGSHLSSIATLGSLLKTWALAIVAPRAPKPATTASPTVSMTNFRIFYPPRRVECLFAGSSDPGFQYGPTPPLPRRVEREDHPATQLVHPFRQVKESSCSPRMDRLRPSRW